jgi:hypothetical protein
MSQNNALEIEAPYGGYGSSLDPMVAPGAAARYGGYADLFTGRVAGAAGDGDVGTDMSQGSSEIINVPIEVVQPKSTVIVGTPVVASAPPSLMMTTGTVPAAAPEKVRWVCFRRTWKLLFFAVLFIMALVIIILLYTVSGESLQISIIVIAAVIAGLMLIEYLALGTDCYVDPVTQTISCKGKMA